MCTHHSSRSSALGQRIGLAALAALFAAASDGGSERWVLDRAVASVDGRAITLHQVQFEGRILMILAGASGAALAALDAATLGSALSTMIDERLAVIDADKLDAYRISDAEVDKQVEAFRAALGQRSVFDRFLATYDADLPSLREVLERHLRAQRNLDGLLRLKALPTDAEVRAYRASRPELADAPMDTARQRLFSERFQVLVRGYLEHVRQEADVRILGLSSDGAAAP